MRYLAIAVLPAVAAALAAAPPAAQSPLQVTWKLEKDVLEANGRAESRAAFVLANRDARKPFPGRGWALHFTALHEPTTGTAGAGFRIENETGSLFRLVPGADFPGVPPGEKVEVDYRTGGRFTATGPGAILVGAELQNEATLAADYLKLLLPAAKGKPPASAGPWLRLELGKIEGHASPEAYELVVDAKDGVRVTGNSPAGVFYGLQSLRSLFPVPGRPGVAAPLALPALRVVDAPRFAYRGFMLDVARNFQPKAEVFRVLDLMARYKLNVLHFHLTEDEGWRVEIPSLPELTTVGARRAHTLDSSLHLPPAFGSGHDVANPYGSGFYTRADYADILRYAAARHIEVVPEVEMPGHARAAIKAMEARARTLREKGDAKGAGQYLLSDPEDRSVYTSAQGYHDNVMNPALESTYAFIGRVVGDLVVLHREAGVPLLHLRSRA
jgi:hexosaminidase